MRLILSADGTDITAPSLSYSGLTGISGSLDAVLRLDRGIKSGND